MANILVLDDEEGIIELFLAFSKRYNHKTITAFNGNEGLEILSKNPELDIIFCDNNMPIMDGYRFTRHVRTNDELREYSKIPIIGTGDFEGKSEYLTDRLHKPFIMQEVEEMTAEYCRKRD